MSKSDVKEIIEVIDRGLKEIASSLDIVINNKQYDGYHSMTKYEINNYMNSYSNEFINKETLFEFFGPNIYNEVKGCRYYFIHEICSERYEIIKIIKALEAAFAFLNPNTADLNTGENYFQTFMINFNYLGCDKLGVDIQKLLIESLLELGFRYGLNPQFKTLNNGDTMWHYLCLVINDFEVLEYVFNLLENKEFNIAAYNYHNVSCLSYLLIKLTNVYRRHADCSKNYEGYTADFEKEFDIDTSWSTVPMIFFNLLERKVLVENNQKVDENPLSLMEQYQGELSDLISISRKEVDPLLRRFLLENNLIKKYMRYKDIWGEPIPEARYYNVLHPDFALKGFKTLDNFLKIYFRLIKKFSYDEDRKETINTLKRVLKKDCKVDESK